MRTTDDIIFTIRKLLRHSRSNTGVEAKLARERAYALMEKHNIHIEHDDTEHYRQEVPGVLGTYWLEELLDTLARANACRVLRPTRVRGHVVVRGYASDVHKTLDLYRSTKSRLMIEASSLWITEKNYFAERMVREIIVGNVDTSPGEILDSSQLREGAIKPLAAAWMRMFYFSAVERLRQTMIQKRVESPVLEDTFRRAPTADEDKERQDAEIKKAVGERDLVAAKFLGVNGARDLMKSAQTRARLTASKIVETYKAPPKRLTANSSWLPPPNRYSYLDMSETSRVVTQAPRVERELDLDIEPPAPKPRGGRELDFD